MMRLVSDLDLMDTFEKLAQMLAMAKRMVKMMEEMISTVYSTVLTQTELKTLTVDLMVLCLKWE